jgi:hypothetical protein
MTSRRSRGGEEAGCSAGSSPPWGCDGRAGSRARNQQANASSEAIGWGRHRHRRPPRAGKGSCKRHPRARGAGASPSRDQGRTVRRRRWISLGSGRSVTPHPGRTQPYLDPTRSGETTSPTPSGGTWGWPPAKTTRTRPSSPGYRRRRTPVPPPAARVGSRSIRVARGSSGPTMTAELPDPPGAERPAMIPRSTGTPHLPAQTSSPPGWSTSTPNPASNRRRESADRRSRPAMDPILDHRHPGPSGSSPTHWGSRSPRAATPGWDPGGHPRTGRPGPTCRRKHSPKAATWGRDPGEARWRLDR